MAPQNKPPRRMNSYSDKSEYVKRLEEAGDTRPPNVIAQENEIDQIFEPEQQEGSDGGIGFLEKFWDSLTE